MAETTEAAPAGHAARGPERCAAAYLLGVQLPTFAVNVPLNNRLQAVELPTLDAAALRMEREAFESRWVYWNAFRTGFGLLTTVLLRAVVHFS